MIPNIALSLAIIAGVLVTPVHAVTTDAQTPDDSYYVTNGASQTEDVPVNMLDQRETPQAASITNKKMVALTFDDGPRPTSTERVLAALQQAHVPGTFFMIGKNVAAYPQIAKEVVDDGNVVGLHTYDHPSNLPWMTPEKRMWELTSTQALIASSTGVHTMLFRPPYGIMTPPVRTDLEQQGYKVVMWNVDTRDWDSLRVTSDDIINTIFSHEQDHMIILFHDGRPMSGKRDNLISALPVIIERLREQGYTFVTVDKLI